MSTVSLPTLRNVFQVLIFSAVFLIGVLMNQTLRTLTENSATSPSSNKASFSICTGDVCRKASHER